MRVFMLGWEFPPYISGGLGTACYGLTKALSQQNTRILFVLPRHVGEDYASHVKVLSPHSPTQPPGRNVGRSAGFAASASPRVASVPVGLAGKAAFENVTFRTVPALFASPYGTGQSVAAIGASFRDHDASSRRADQNAAAEPRRISVLSPPQEAAPAAGEIGYDGDLISQAHRYADLCVQLAAGESFDVIHAHDWLTFPAGMAVAAATGKPLIVHVHSTEYDRSGENIDTRIYAIERAGIDAADRVIAVSHLTRSLLENRYGVAADKIDVVYNGIQNGPPLPAADRPGIRKSDKVVLFLGRITMQKGPEYFVAAAKKVLARYDKVKFVMAGTGDKVRDVIELAAREGIGHKVLFTGFLKPDDVQRVFKMADVYVMPSVSEPFGIAALEAVSHDVPVILSRQSGVSEVLRHALKVDFWDIDEMANKIIALLRHPPLGATLREHADLEVRRLTWDDAAAKTLAVYEKTLVAVPL